MYDLYIANKNYSSWSLRPWVLMRQLGIAFNEHLLRFGEEATWSDYLHVSANGKVPCLKDGETTVWDSLAIVEYLAEAHPGVWPASASARAWARSAAAEMHSSFGELRNRCSMTCGLRVQLHERPAALLRDMARIEALWNEGLTRFGGPYLAGIEFSAVDAFFAPIAFRVQTYDLPLDATTAAYRDRLLVLEPMREWYTAALHEDFRDEAHEVDMQRLGRVIADYRVGAPASV